MPDQSDLLVPLRSNGSALLTGSPIESVRRRLKFASQFFDHVFLEGGVFTLAAGLGGSSSFFNPPNDRELPRWQSPSRRGADQRQPLAVGVGREEIRRRSGKADGLDPRGM